MADTNDDSRVEYVTMTMPASHRRLLMEALDDLKATSAALLASLTQDDYQNLLHAWEAGQKDTTLDPRIRATYILALLGAAYVVACLPSDKPDVPNG